MNGPDQLNDMIETLRRHIRMNKRLTVLLMAVVILNAAAALFNLWRVMHR